MRLGIKRAESEEVLGRDHLAGPRLDLASWLLRRSAENSLRSAMFAHHVRHRDRARRRSGRPVSLATVQRLRTAPPQRAWRRRCEETCGVASICPRFVRREGRRSKCLHQCSTCLCLSTGTSQVRTTAGTIPGATTSCGCTLGTGSVRTVRRGGRREVKVSFSKRNQRDRRGPRGSAYRGAGRSLGR